MGRKRIRTIRQLALYIPAVCCFGASLLVNIGPPMDGLFFILGILLLSGAMIMERRRQNREMSAARDELIRCMNMKRHDWLNHIQVLMGYLSLGNQEGLDTYLQRLKSDAEQENAIFRLGYAPLTHYLLTRGAMEKGVLDIHIIFPLKVKNNQQGERLLTTLRKIDAFMQQQTDDPLSKTPVAAGVTLAAQQSDIMLYFDLPNRADVHRRLLQNRTTLDKKIGSRHVDMVIEREGPNVEWTVRIAE